jgi:hypothetical protein
LSLVRTLTFSFAYCIHVIYFTTVKTALGYASVVWNFIKSTDANKLESIQQKLAALCFISFFLFVHCTYAWALEQLWLYTSRKRRCQVKYCSYFIWFIWFQILSSFENCSSVCSCSVHQRFFFFQILLLKKLSFCSCRNLDDLF